ncbi:hypothetical protein Bca101_019028 [Brassica carinata]
MVLPFHLPDLAVEFDSCYVPTLTISKLKFISWMKCNAIYPQAQNYLYTEFPTNFVWDNKIRDWRPRRRTYTRGSVLAQCPDGLNEIYYLCEMLHVIRGPCSYKDLMTVNDVVYQTFRDAYMAFVFDYNH